MPCNGCPTPTRAQAHCASCHRTFSGVWGFDKHRSRGACLDPASLGFQLRARDGSPGDPSQPSAGVWKRPPSERNPWAEPLYKLNNLADAAAVILAYPR